MIYNPYYQPIQPTQPQNSRIWVQGEAGAKSYLVAPNNSVDLWDTESQTIYIKSADATGIPSMKALDYTIRPETAQNARGAFLANEAGKPTADDIKGLQVQIDALREELRALRKEAPDE